MLHITASTKTLKEEVRSALTIVTNITDYLYAINPETDYYKAIGDLVKSIPEYKVLARDAESAKQLLRKVCTGEVPVSDALESFNKARRELNLLNNALGAIVFPK